MAEHRDRRGFHHRIKFLQHSNAGRGNSDMDHAPVPSVAVAPHQLAPLQPAEQPRDVGIASDHPLPDLSTSKSVGARAAKDSKHVVLRIGQALVF